MRSIIFMEVFAGEELDMSINESTRNDKSKSKSQGIVTPENFPM